MSITQSLAQSISRQLAPITLCGAILAYFYPPIFLVFNQVFLGEKLFLWLFAATMFALGVVLKPDDLKLTLKEPKNIGLGVATQYTVMPLLAYALCWLAGLSPTMTLGFIIVACAPGAMASNVIVYLAGGVLAFSIALTMVSTLLAPLLTPALVELLGGEIMHIPFVPMMITIIKSVIVPLFLGMALRSLLSPKAQKTASHISPAAAAIAIMIICAYVVAANQDRIAHMSLNVVAVVLALNLLGYLAGWFLARIYGFDRPHQATLSIEIGMQNAGMGVALALKHFPPETALPGALFAVWAILSSTLASSYFRFQAKRRMALS